jgi:hypothetical protein
MSPPTGSRTLKKLVKMMELHLKTLEASSSDQAIVKAYAAVIEFVDLEGSNIIDFDDGPVNDPRDHYKYIEEAKSMSLDSLEKLLSAEGVSRRSMEYVAIYRFGVPKGSMRSIGTKDDLREKLLVMIRNQRVHKTIGEVAKMDHTKKND